jgi:hypothetical protein
MTKQEIKDLLIVELNNSPEKQTFNNMKSFVVNTIVEPSIQLQVIYRFENSLTDDSINILKLICVNEWGFAPYMTIEYAIINMASFF